VKYRPHELKSSQYDSAHRRGLGFQYQSPSERVAVSLATFIILTGAPRKERHVIRVTTDMAERVVNNISGQILFRRQNEHRGGTDDGPVNRMGGFLQPLFVGRNEQPSLLLGWNTERMKNNTLPNSALHARASNAQRCSTSCFLRHFLTFHSHDHIHRSPQVVLIISWSRIIPL
jgi:hypothetical protein